MDRQSPRGIRGRRRGAPQARADQIAGLRPDSEPGAKSDGSAPLIHRVDALIAGLIVAGAAALLYITTTFEKVPELLSQNVGPEVFPQLVLIAIVLLALGLPFEHRTLRDGAARLDKARSERIGATGWATAGLLAAIGALMPLAGTLVTLFLICLALPMLWGERRLRIVLPFAILFPLAVKLVFETLLEVPFEPGLLAALGS